ncbi:MAG: hypothetical protein Q9160_006813 [Pyrenula sp. 1 TL-2023]
MYYHNSALRPLPSNRHFRLLRLLPESQASPKIQCSLSVHSIETFPGIEYSALSYTWGEADPVRDSSAVIEIDSAEVHIRQNVFSFLEVMRYEQTQTPIFIDAICINQEDDKEKDEQVRHMGNIYKKASTVIVWLGKYHDLSPRQYEAWDQFPRFQDFIKTASTSHSRYDGYLDSRFQPERVFWPKGAFECMEYICSRPYWTRLWIIQEVLLARSIVVYCGGTESENRVKFDWQTLAHLRPQSGLIQPDPDSWSLDVKPKPLFWGRAGRVFRAKARRRMLDGSLSMMLAGLEGLEMSSPLDDFHTDLSGCFPVYQALRQFGDQICEDPRDKLYGLLGVVEDAESIKPDYSTPIVQVCNKAVERSLTRMRKDLQLINKRRYEYEMLYDEIIKMFPLSKEEIVDVTAKAEALTQLLLDEDDKTEETGGSNFTRKPRKFVRTMALS